jgi:predicted amino acid racemase
MAHVTLHRQNLKTNFEYLDTLFDNAGIHWGVVSKVLCGSELYLKELIDLGVREVHDSRIQNLRRIKQINSDIQTVYIKPPEKSNVADVIRYADVSFNSHFATLENLSREAVEQDVQHKVFIMIELGDLREGVMGKEVVDFYGRAFELPNLDIVGLGTNLNCMHGVMPSEDKLIQLSLYKQLIEARFDKRIKWVSGGTSVVLPLLMEDRLPRGINHFRIGETLYFGNNLFEDAPIEGMEPEVFKLYAEIIELNKKPKAPIGNVGEDPQGNTYEVDESDYGEKSYLAILDVGLLDINPDYIEPEDDAVEIAGASSDMIVVDFGDSKYDYEVGDHLTFQLEYMGLLDLLSSDYVDKQIAD